MLKIIESVATFMTQLQRQRGKHIHLKTDSEAAI